MQYAGKEISEMSDDDILNHYQNCLSAEAKRDTSSMHQKFTRQDGKAIKLPDINPEFVKAKEALKSEIDNRKLELK